MSKIENDLDDPYNLMGNMVLRFNSFFDKKNIANQIRIKFSDLEKGRLESLITRLKNREITFVKAIEELNKANEGEGFTEIVKDMATNALYLRNQIKNLEFKVDLLDNIVL